VVARSLPRRLFSKHFCSEFYRNAAAIWRQKLCTSKADKAIDLQNFCNEIDWYYKACFRRASAFFTARS
jgi:hypothetical protein